MECIVCFETIEKSSHITCSNNKCSIKICVECFETYIDISLKENQIPKCPNAKCNSYIIRRNVAKLIKNLEKYDMACLNELTKLKGDDVNKKIESNEIIKKLRVERKLFIDTNFPPAISKVANLILKDKLKQLERKKTKLIETNLSESYKLCMNNVCNGHLDKNYKCQLCNTQFCKDCEQEIDLNHVCNKETIDTLNIIKSFVNCPKCKVTIEKSEGCDHMTCANCNTHFSYNTGEVGGSGNHNQNVNITLKDKELLSTIFKEYLIKNDLFELMLKYESIKPKTSSDIQIKNILKKYFIKQKLGDIDPELKVAFAKDISISFDNYIFNTNLEKQYNKNMLYMEKCIFKNTLTEKIILDMISLINYN